jgi:hypothetical protein
MRGASAPRSMPCGAAATGRARARPARPELIAVRTRAQREIDEPVGASPLAERGEDLARVAARARRARCVHGGLHLEPDHERVERIDVGLRPLAEQYAEQRAAAPATRRPARRRLEHGCE